MVLFFTFFYNIPKIIAYYLQVQGQLVKGSHTRRHTQKNKHTHTPRERESDRERRYLFFRREI